MIKNEQLQDAIIFKSDDSWRIKLVYSYEDEIGKHLLIFPNIQFPFNTYAIPNVGRVWDLYSESNATEPLSISLNEEEAILYKGICKEAEERGVKTPSELFDIITEYAVHEMTMDEIEKRLGYKVKIVNRKE